jgi:hypothetical protein
MDSGKAAKNERLERAAHSFTGRGLQESRRRFRAFGHSTGVQWAPRLRASVALLDAQGMENENAAPGPSFSAAHNRP